MAAALGDAWAIDLQFHSTEEEKPLKILSIVDEVTKEALAGKLRCSITAGDINDELGILAIEHGSPRGLRINQGPKAISKELLGLAHALD